jgi:hypothetical protein
MSPLSIATPRSCTRDVGGHGLYRYRQRRDRANGRCDCTYHAWGCLHHRAFDLMREDAKRLNAGIWELEPGRTGKT